MKKKLLALVLVVVLALTSVIGGTMAYLQDTDEAVNVMTLGNVDIKQIEQERVTQTNSGKDELQEFQDDKPLYPAVGEIKWVETDSGRAFQEWPTGGSSALFDAGLKNVVDKFVFVENSGKSDAYVRTWFAFEAGSLTAAEMNNGMIHWNRNDTHWDWTDFSEDMVATIDGVKYYLRVATYKGNTGTDGSEHKDGVLGSGETTRPSLLQVFLDSKAGNETIAAFGDTYEILVFSQAIQTEGFENATAALNEGFGEPVAENHPFGGLFPDEWDGTADTSWYNETDTEFVITTAEQLAGLAVLVDGGNSFEGKIIKLDSDIDLYVEGDEEPISFEPIGSYEYDTAFSGTFDGQGYTISNMYQNGWALENGIYDGDDLGLGLFGKVSNATIRNLKIDKANQPSEFNLIGSVAGAAYGECVFEDISVTNSYMGNHSYYSGSVVGWASGNHKYINCDIDSTNVISSQWGDFNNANGGIIGGAGASGTYYFENCDVACVIDSYNDVTSAYEWYAYRNAGMLIGNTGLTSVDENGTTHAAAPNVTCVNCTVTYGEWANYHYCQFNAMGYPWVRVEAGESTHAYGNARYDYATDANGNNVVDENHVHNEGEGHDVLLVFDQLFGGAQGGVYGNPTHEGVTVIYNNK